MRFVLWFGLISALGRLRLRRRPQHHGAVPRDSRRQRRARGLHHAGPARRSRWCSGSGRALVGPHGRHWAISITGYALTMVSVPLMAAAWTLWPAAVLVVSERFGKAVRTPARDTMLAQASTDLGRGRTFAIHEALDQSGAFVGPLVVAAAIALGGGYRWGFGILAVPGAAAIVVLCRCAARSIAGALRAPRTAALGRAHRVELPAPLLVVRGLHRAEHDGLRNVRGARLPPAGPPRGPLGGDPDRLRRGDGACRPGRARLRLAVRPHRAARPGRRAVLHRDRALPVVLDDAGPGVGGRGGVGRRARDAREHDARGGGRPRAGEPARYRLRHVHGRLRARPGWPAAPRSARCTRTRSRSVEVFVVVDAGRRARRVRAGQRSLGATSAAERRERLAGRSAPRCR